MIKILMPGCSFRTSNSNSGHQKLSKLLILHYTVQLKGQEVETDWLAMAILKFFDFVVVALFLPLAAQHL